MPIHPLSPLALLVYMGVALALLLYVQTYRPRAAWKKRVEAAGFLQRKGDIPSELKQAGEFEARAAFSRKGNGFTLWLLEAAPFQALASRLPAGAPFDQSVPFVYVQFDRIVRAPVKTCLLPLHAYENEIEARVSPSASARLGSVKNRLVVPPPHEARWIAWASTVERSWNPCPPPPSFWHALTPSFPLSIEFMENGLRFEMPAPKANGARAEFLRIETMDEIERIARSVVLSAPDHGARE